MLAKLNHELIPGLSRTLNFNSQDFPRPNSFSRTFQVLEILGKNPGLSRRRRNPGHYLPSFYIHIKLHCLTTEEQG